MEIKTKQIPIEVSFDVQEFNLGGGYYLIAQYASPIEKSNNEIQTYILYSESGEYMIPFLRRAIDFLKNTKNHSEIIRDIEKDLLSEIGTHGNAELERELREELRNIQWKFNVNVPDL